MESKSIEYIKSLGKTPEELPEKYRENLETMQEFAEIYSLVEPGSDEAKEAKEEYEDYDKKILQALKRDYPLPKEEKPAEKKEKKPQAKVKEEMPMPPVDENGQRRIDKAALDALEAHLNTLPQTKKLHTNQKGEYTDGRQALHAEIITKEMSDNACIRRDAPIAILTGGLPGSGKSTFIRKNRDWIANPAIFKIDADEVRAKLPEYKGWNAPQTHEESRDIVNQLIKKIGADGCSFDVVYDGTMNKSEKYGPLIKKLKKEGYQVFVLYMKVDKATSMKRAMGRYQKSGRYVPRFVIEEGSNNGLAAFNEIKKMVDGYVLVDGATQKVLEKGGKEIPKDRDYSALAGDEPAAGQGRPPAPNRATEYNWKDKADLEQLSPVVIHCQHYHLEAQEEMEVGLKGKGNATRKVPVKPGEHLIFDDGGYLVFVMDAESFSRKCIEKTTLEGHELDKHQAGLYKKKYEAIKMDAVRMAEKLREERYKPSQQEEKEPKPADKAEDKPEPAPKASKPASNPKAKPAPNARKKAKPEGKKKTAAAPEDAGEPKAKPQAGPNPSIAAIEKEIGDIRLAQGKKPLDKDQFRKEYRDLEEKKDSKSYLAYIRKHLKQAQEEGVQFGEEETIKLGIAIRPLIQRKGAALLDILLTSKKVLAPTYDNLIRWTESPGRYDLQGVDVSAKAEESVKARKVEKPSLFDLVGL